MIFKKIFLFLFLVVLLPDIASAQDNESSFKINSFDLDFGFYGVSEGFSANYLKTEEFHYKTEYEPTFISRATRRSSSTRPVFNGAINLSHFSNKKNEFNENQILRLSVGFIVESQINLGSVHERISYRYDTLYVTSMSAQTGMSQVDTVYQDSSITNYDYGYITGKSFKVGAQYLFSTSKNTFRVSVGPGVDFNLMFGNRLEERERSYTSIDSYGTGYSSYTIPEYYVNNIKTTKVSAIIGVVPHLALYLLKNAKQRNNWFDNSSIFFSGTVGSRITLGSKFDLAPAFVFGANFGLRYAL